jgi:aspartyl-tRNA(Asn)/glutamyl-tRNA(Gln) amidotransferase subunit C
MPPTLTIADVERIAALAQLELTGEEKLLFTRQLADILAYAEQVQAIDTSGVPATAHVNSAERTENSAQRTERDDVPRPCLSVEDALANAPDSAPGAGLFRVPRVIGG